MRPIAHVAGGGRGAGVGPLVLASIIWGTTGTAQAVSHVHASSPVLGAARLLAGSTALAVFARKSGRGAARAAIARPRQRRWVLSAGIATAVYQAAFFAAVTRTGVALGTLLALGSAPIFCGLLARLLIGERVPPSWATATACAVIGSGLLLLPGAQRSADVLGIALSLLAGACYALYTVSAKRLLGSGAAPLGILVATTGTGAAILLPVLIAGAGELASGAGLLLVGWLGLIATAAGYALFVRGLAVVPSGTAGTLSLAEPLTATLLGTVALSERWSPSAAGGAALLAIGLVLTASGSRAQRPAQAPA